MDIRMPEPIYVVLVEHNTGHGPSSAVIFASPDPLQAVERALTVEKLGYELYSTESGATVFRLMPGEPLPKEKLKYSLTPPHDYPVVFSWRRLSPAKREEAVEMHWFDRELERRYYATRPTVRQ